MKKHKRKQEEDWEIVVKWVLHNKDNEARYLKRHKMYAIRDTYQRMGYVYEPNCRVPKSRKEELR